MSAGQAGYVYLRRGPHPEIARTVSLGDSILVDVDADGRPIGVEFLEDRDWRDALVTAAVSGRMRLT